LEKIAEALPALGGANFVARVLIREEGAVAARGAQDNLEVWPPQEAAETLEQRRTVGTGGSN